MRRSAESSRLPTRNMTPNLASQMRVAFSSMALNTGSSSPGELEMTCSTSEVAVCCSSASERSSVRRSSLSSRVFSIAITACAAKFCTSSICLSVNGTDLLAVDDDGPDQASSLSIGTPTHGTRAAERGRDACDLNRPARRRYGRSPLLERRGQRTTCTRRVRTKRSARLRGTRLAPVAVAELRGQVARRHRRSETDVPNFGLADASRVLQHGFEHRLQLAGRADDDLEHLGGRGLLLSIGEIVVRASSLSSRVFSMAMTACAAKFCTSSICLSVNGRTSWRIDVDGADQFVVLEHWHND